MNKEDFIVLVAFWSGIEKAYYAKAYHLREHLNEWMEQHGSWPLTADNAPFVMRLLDAANHHVPDKESTE